MPSEKTQLDLASLKVQIYADGADAASMLDMGKSPLIKGFTTNPTLMRKAGVSDYRSFARTLLESVNGRPISFEVISDDFVSIEREAREIASWGGPVYVKIPVSNTRGESSAPLIAKLAREGIRINVTALTQIEQVSEVSNALQGHTPSIISLFAGRIADTGRDPVPMVASAVEIMRKHPTQQLIWASPRELLNIFQADRVGCHIITITVDIFKKLSLVGKDLAKYSLETVEMFHRDAMESKLKL